MARLLPLWLDRPRRACLSHLILANINFPPSMIRSPYPISSKLKVFVSYSRSDIEFADQLCAALLAYGITPSIDREGIHGAERWQERLGQLILEADTVVFILTPASAVSNICKWEVDEAVRLNKRVVPLIWRPLGEAKPHEHLRGLNYIYFYDERSVTGSGFGTGLMRLIDTLTTDVGWIREHTRLGEQAARWERDGRRADALPRGIELGRLREWREMRPANAPELTGLQRDFLEAADEAEAERNDAERRQLEECVRHRRRGRRRSRRALGHSGATGIMSVWRCCSRCCFSPAQFGNHGRRSGARHW